MRLFIYTLLLVVLGLPAYAAEPVYNTTQSSSSRSGALPTLYNSGNNNSSSAAPISIKNLSQGKTARGSYKNYRSAYGSDNAQEKKYTTSMSPNQIKAKRAQDQARAKRYADQARARSEQRRKETAAKRQQNKVETVQDRTNELRSRFQSPSSEQDQSESSQTASNNTTRRPQVRRQNPVFLQNNRNSTVPKRVFNSNF